MKRLFSALFALSALSLGAQTLTEWDNVAVYELNRERAHTVAIPMESEAQLRESQLEDSPYYLSLNGTWKFRWVGTPSSASNSFYQDSFNANSWDDITVPYPWQVYAAQHSKNWDKPLYVNTSYPFTYTSSWSVMADRPSHFTYSGSKANPVGSYRREFTLPQAWEGRDVYVRFNGAGHGYYVWVNGRFAGYAEDSYLPSEFKITDFVREGTNNISVRVYRFTSGSFLECQDYWRLTGITRDVFLWSAPKQQIRDFFFRTTSLSDEGTQASAALDVTLSGPSLSGASLKARILDGSHEVASVTKAVTKAGTVSLAMNDIKGIQAWNAEEPKLYDLVLSLTKSGKAIDLRGGKVGFRTVGVRKDGALIVNGRRVIFHGVNRHVFSCETGRTVSRQEMEEDVRLMKRLNINAIRTSHYPADPYFYDLCDRYGMYVLAEADVECHGNGSISGVEAFREPMCARNVNQVLWLRNHVSICLWSAGNESGGGINFQAISDSITKHDPTRLTHYEGNSSYFTVSSTMYGSLGDIASRLRNNLNDYKAGKQVRPHVQCENTHSMGNSQGNQREFFDLYEYYPSSAGEFIWDWRDQGLRMPVSGSTTTYFAYGGDFGDNPNDGNFCCNGVVLPDGTFTSKSFSTKKIYQPVDFRLLDADKGEYRVKNKRNFRRLDDLDVTYTILRDGIAITPSLPFPTPDVAAGDSLTVTLQALDGLTLDPASEYQIRLSAKQKEATWWAEAGYEVASESFLLREAEKPAYQNTSSTTLSCTKSSSSITLRGNGFTLTFQRGEISSYRVGGRTLIASPLTLQAFRAPTDNDKGIASQWDNYGLRNLTLAAGQMDTLWADDHRSIDVKVTNTYKAAGDISFTTHNTYKVFSDGTVIANHTILPSVVGLELPRLGMRTEMPAAYEQFRWFGRGPWDSYRDRIEACHPALYTSTVTEQWTPYVLPQETGNKEDVRWLSLTDTKGDGLLIVAADKQLAASTGHWRPEDIYTNRGNRVKHPYQVNFCTNTVVNIDAYTRALGNASCGADVISKYQIPCDRTHLSYMLMPLSGALSDEALSDKARVGSPISSYVDIEDNGKGRAVLSTRLPGATIHYSIDGGEERTYTTPVDMTAGGTITAWSTADGFFPSIENTMRFNLYLDKSRWTIYSCDSQQGGNEVAKNLTDGNPNTIWHTSYGSNITDCPHEVVIDLRAAYQIEQFYYQGRQDGGNGRVADYDVYFSNNAKVWGPAAASGTFANGAMMQYVSIPSHPVARYVRFVVRSTHDGKKYASAAEIGIVASAKTTGSSPSNALSATTLYYYIMHVPSGLFLHYTDNSSVDTYALGEVTDDNLSDNTYRFLFTPVSGFAAFYTVKGRQPVKFWGKNENRYSLDPVDAANDADEWFQVEQLGDDQVYLRCAGRYPKYFNFDRTTPGSFVYLDKATPATFLLIKQSKIGDYLTHIDEVTPTLHTRPDYYTLAGVKTLQPTPGVNIVHQGGAARKVVTRQ